MTSIEQFKEKNNTKLNNFTFESITSHDLILESKLLPPLEICHLLLEDTWFKFTRYYINDRNFLVYNKIKGIYEIFDKGHTMAILSSCFLKIGVKVPFITISCLVNELSISNMAYPGDFRVDHDKYCISFKDGVINTKDKTFTHHSPHLFVLRYSEDLFLEDKRPESFLKFLHDFTGGCKIKATLIRSFLYVILTGHYSTETFLMCQGVGGTGKSVLNNIMSFVVGDYGTVSTDLSSLKNDRFETSVLEHARLVLLSDIGKCTMSEFDVLKGLVSRDKIKGRKKFIQGASDIRLNGLVVVNSNYKVDISHDTSGALDRRMRVLIANDKAMDPIKLLSINNDIWDGPISDDLSGIIKWALSISGEASTQYLEKYFQLLTPDRTPSIVESFCLTHLEYKEDEYTYVQGKDSLSRAFDHYMHDLEGSDHKKICERDLAVFITAHFRKKHLKTPRVRRERGFSISNLLIRENPLSKDITFDPSNLEDVTPEIQHLVLDAFNYSSSKLVFESKIIPILQQSSNLNVRNDDRVDQISNGEGNEIFLPMETVEYDKQLYVDYASLFFSHKESREKINSFFKDKEIDMVSLVRRVHNLGEQPLKPFHLKEVSRLKAYDKKLKYIASNPRGFAHLGTSPRIRPIKINGVNAMLTSPKALRALYFEQISNALPGFVVCDLDMRSCYISLLVALYPEKTRFLEQPLKEGMWKYMERLHEKNGNALSFNKSFAKVCVYASFFQGGKNAFKEKILEVMRDDLAVTKEEFIDSPSYQDFVYQAESYAETLYVAELTTNLRNFSEELRKSIGEGNKVKSGAGWVFESTKSNWRNIFPRVLNGFEFEFISKFSILLAGKFPDIIFLHPFHDGVAIALKKEDQSKIEDDILLIAKQVSSEMKLSPSIEMEAKYFIYKQ